jgi:outer membrane lipoprotein-sorting protein
MNAINTRRWRWAVPGAGILALGVAAAIATIPSASAAPVLAPRTAAQLLASVGQASHVQFTGTVVETASLGLPSLPSNLTGDSSSPYALLTGSHTMRIWYGSPDHFRLSVPGTLSETDLIRDGGTLWEWESGSDAVAKYSVPDKKDNETQTAPLTPRQAANDAISAVGPTTTVSTDPNVSVAGQSAYELVLAPKSDQSLIGQIRIAVDSANGLPLRVQVFARGAASPAIQVGYTQIQFVAPAASELTFTPPPGSHVTNGQASEGQETQGQEPATKTIGSSWLGVVQLPGSVLGQMSGKDQELTSALFGTAVDVSGSWGSGRLIRTSLVDILITDNGNTMYVGAVQPSVLYAAAAGNG